jgi:hypothetical protein
VLTSLPHLDLAKFVDADTVLFNVMGTEYALNSHKVLSSPQRLYNVGYPISSKHQHQFLFQLGVFFKSTYRYMSVLAVLAKLYTAGADVSWKQFHARLSLNMDKVDLPSYPFQRQRYWYPLYNKVDTTHSDTSIFQIPSLSN